MIIDKFPLDLINSYYVGRDFVRISPITGHPAKGIVKEIVLRKSTKEVEGIYYSKPQFGVISTENVNYDFNEIYFNPKTDTILREKILRRIVKEKELEILNKIVD